MCLYYAIDATRILAFMDRCIRLKYMFCICMCLYGHRSVYSQFVDSLTDEFESTNTSVRCFISLCCNIYLFIYLFTFVLPNLMTFSANINGIEMMQREYE